MNQSNFLLLMMIISYIVPIYSIYKKCSSQGIQPSVSSIISLQECKKTIFSGIIVMTTFTILYELNIRSNNPDNLSLYSIIGLLLGIGGVIFIDENKKLHYFFAGLVFISIIGFMINNCFRKHCDFLNLSLYIQFLLFIILILSIKNTPKDDKDDKDDTLKILNVFFWAEIFLIINFAIFYIYLHFIR